MATQIITVSQKGMFHCENIKCCNTSTAIYNFVADETILAIMKNIDPVWYEEEPNLLFKYSYIDVSFRR